MQDDKKYLIVGNEMARKKIKSILKCSPYQINIEVCAPQKIENINRETEQNHKHGWYRKFEGKKR